jgi:hypothetical protein
MSSNPVKSGERLAHLETQVGSVATSLNSFINESKEWRDRVERDQSNIWNAIKDQGDNLGRAVEKLSSKGQISWGMIVSTMGMILTITAGFAAVGHAMMESRMRQVEIRQEHIREDVKENREWLRELERERFRQ